MNVIRKLPGQEPETAEIDNTLEALQEAVGGYIETVTLAEDACLICNEEGQLLGLPYNPTLMMLNIRGPALIVGTEGEEFCDVPAPDFWMDAIRRTMGLSE